MRRETSPRFFLLAFGLLLSLSIPASAQVVPAGTEQVLPFGAGGGFSNMSPGRGNGYMIGYAVWADYRPQFIVQRVQGLSIEGQVRYLGFDRSSTQAGLIERTFGGGATYTWRHFRNFRPYGKAMIGYGTINFPPVVSLVTDPPSTPGGPTPFATQTVYDYDSRVMYTLGGGIQYRIKNSVWVRADYEYEMWPGLLGGTLKPQGVTIGVQYDMWPPWRFFSK
jgi:opacity protein-like surface antigen